MNAYEFIQLTLDCEKHEDLCLPNGYEDGL